MKKDHILFWIPRLGSIFFVILALFGFFEQLIGSTLSEIIIGLVIIIVFILVLIFSWKYEPVGSVFFIILSLYYFYSSYVLSHFFLISRFFYFGIISIITGIFFIIDELYRKSA